MIKVNSLDKTFDGFKALSDLNLNVKKGSIYGLVGTNGAGKTTLIKHVTGILRPDRGEILIEEENVYENIPIKERLGYIPDDLYFFSTYNLKESAKFYRSIYPNWNQPRYEHMVKQFELNEKRKLSKFSKGMQKQAAFILTMSSMPDYLILDEPIDGLDPIIRKLVWKYIVEDVAEREMTVLVSSHNLRELEGICDHVGIIDHGKLLLERALSDLCDNIVKVQAVFQQENALDGFDVLHRSENGRLQTVIIRGERSWIERALQELAPVFCDILPLTLEEIFIYELGGGDNEIESIIF